MSTTTEISKGVISVGTWNLTKIITSAIAYPILARLLGTDGYGQYAYCLAVIMLASPFANMGITYVLTKHLAERPGDLVWRNNLAAFSGLTNVIAALSVGAVVGILLLRHPVSGRSPAIMAAVVVSIIILEQVWFYSRGVLYGLHREELAALPATLGAILSAALGIGFAMSGMGVLGVLTGVLIANLAVALLTFRFACQFIEWPGSDGLRRILPVSSLVAFGLSSMLFTALSLVLYRADIILVRHLASDSQAGLYAAAIQWSQFVWFVPIAVEAVMLQGAAHLWAENRTNEITKMLSHLLRFVALVTAFFLTIVLVFADDIVRLYFGVEFSDASLMLRILVPGVFGFSLARVTWPVIQARGHVVPLVVVLGSVTLVNLGLNWFLILKWEALGASVATSLSYASVAVVYAWMIREWGVQPFTRSYGTRFLVLCMVTATCLVPISVAVSSAFLAVIIGSALAVCIYWTGALWLGLITVKEIQQVLGHVPDPVRNFAGRLFSLLQPTLLRIELSVLKK